MKAWLYYFIIGQSRGCTTRFEMLENIYVEAREMNIPFRFYAVKI